MTIKKILFIAIFLILILIALLILLYPPTTPIPDSRLSDVSHLIQDPRDHIVLRREYVSGGCGSIASDFFRLFPNGSKASDAFRVPEGRLLIVTDVDWWVADFREGRAAGYASYFYLALEHRSGAVISTFPVFEDTGLTDPQDRLGRSVPMTAGFAVAPKTRICPFSQVAPSDDRDLLRMDVILRGYLIDDTKADEQGSKTAYSE